VHVTAHVPQLAASVCRSTHADPQRVCPVAHGGSQTPRMQLSPDAHAVAQFPQWAMSLFGSMQRSPQRMLLPAHVVPIWHTPPTQGPPAVHT